MVKWTPKSEEDIDKILDYISENFNVELAAETVYFLIDFVEATLSANPLAGMILEANPLFSKIIYDGNSIYYCENPKDKDIYIVYVQARKIKFESGRLNTQQVA